MASVWKDDAIVELARTMHYAGYTASQIATAINRRLGCTSAYITRNAVIGIIHRKGWPRSEAGTGKRAKPTGAKPKPKRASKPRLEPRVERAPALKPEPVVPKGPDLVIPVGERKTLDQLEPGDCRWPFGDPKHDDFHFCGKAQVEGLPYCEFHVRRAYQPPKLNTQPTRTRVNPRSHEDA